MKPLKEFLQEALRGFTTWTSGRIYYMKPLKDLLPEAVLEDFYYMKPLKDLYYMKPLKELLPRTPERIYYLKP